LGLILTAVFDELRYTWARNRERGNGEGMRSTGEPAEPEYNSEGQKLTFERKFDFYF
jgi:hypothetical protein